MNLVWIYRLRKNLPILRLLSEQEQDVIMRHQEESISTVLFLPTTLDMSSLMLRK